MMAMFCYIIDVSCHSQPELDHNEMCFDSKNKRKKRFPSSLLYSNTEQYTYTHRLKQTHANNKIVRISNKKRSEVKKNIFVSFFNSFVRQFWIFLSITSFFCSISSVSRSLAIDVCFYHLLSSFLMKNFFPTTEKILFLCFYLFLFIFDSLLFNLL